jgi:hypothetical protein
MPSLGITLYFVIPRAPTFNFPTNDIFSVDNSTIHFSRTPTNFTFQASFNMLGTRHPQESLIPVLTLPIDTTADAGSSYLPVHITSLYTTVYDLNTNKVVGTGELTNYILPHKSNQPVTLPVTFAYSAVNASDTTCENRFVRRTSVN